MEPFKNITEDAIGFVVEVKENTFMDIKNICLSDSARRLFKPEHVLYLLILNMSNTDRVNINKSFSDFIMANVGISRAFFYKLIGKFVEGELLSKTAKKGWYKLHNIHTTVIQRTN